jgi:predicted amino acid dehydrogenase
VNISLGSSGRDYDEQVEFLDQPFRLIRLGTDADVRRAEELVAQWRDTAAAIALSTVAEADSPGRSDVGAASLRRLRVHGDHAAVTDGTQLRDVLQEWAIRQAQAQEPGLFTNARVVVLSGLDNYRAATVLHEVTDNLRFADPLHRFGIPSVLRSIPALDRFGRVVGWSADRIPRSVSHTVTEPGRRLNRRMLQSALRNCDVVVASFPELLEFEPDCFADSTIITSAISEHRLAELGRWGVISALDIAPQPFGVTVSIPVLAALMSAATRTGPERLSENDLLEMIEAAGLQPRLLYPGRRRRKSRFAFVIHPLSQEQIRNVEALDMVGRVAPAPVMSAVEKAVAYAPPFTYSRITGITSPTGDTAEGWLITVGGTPGEMMSHSPEFTYRRLLAAAEIAKRSGAQIMGLGAFTKVVGDAGVTVAKRAPLPITTGNSYSASGALWALHDAIRRLGVAEVDERGRLRGSAMVVGATGSIGSVCARLLALACDELWLVAPQSAKLLALKSDIERHEHRARIHVATSPDEHLPDMDAIVTATSGIGKRVLDIMKLKPGCVVTDIALPPDLSAEEVARRPDVMVVHSGEIKLPGDAHMRPIGLPPGVVYACLAETIVLALEGRFENFTIGRNLEADKVKQIYRLGLKHGMQLATISGAHGVFTDDDIAAIRKAALAARSAADSLR